MALRRVAVIFDHKARPDTTGVYCRRALGRLVDVEHFLPSELSQIPRTGFDLYLNIDDGLNYRLPQELRPCAWWAIDTHLDLCRYLEKAPDFDFVYTAQRDGAASLRESGISSAAWLPLACDPEIHRKYEVAKRFDVCFVGNLFAGPRNELLQIIRDRFPNSFVGQKFFEEMAETYSASRIVFNRSIENDVNMRVFEALACGSLLVTNDLSENGQAELFQDEVHLAVYRNKEELLERLAYFLRHNERRERIALTGRQEALSKHTYRHRMERLLCEVENGLSKCVASASTANSLRGNYESNGDLDDQAFLGLTPRSAKNILLVAGRATGYANAIKTRQVADVLEISLSEKEKSPNANLSGHFSELPPNRILTFPRQSFDAVILDGAIERTTRPLLFLNQARGWLKPDGRLIACVSNLRFHSVLRGLIQGNWTYDSDGALHQDHLRLFTRREIEKLFFRAGFAIDELRLVPGAGFDLWQQQGQTGTVSIGALQIQGLHAEDAQEFYVSHYWVSAITQVTPDYGLTSIVIVTYNQLNYTRQCVESILRLTDEPIEFVFVDNNSTDDTVEYLHSVPNSRLIANKENRGFPAAANQGIRASAGSQILLLNNDTIVTTSWLRRLLRALHSDPQVGLVGPCSNFVSGPQQVPVTYGDDLCGLDGFAWTLGKKNSCIVEETDRLVGFCLLIRREVVDKIGFLDEQFGIGCFEDDDYTRRALEAGFRALIARDAFIHHYGGPTFVGSGVDFASLMERNRQLFLRKWEKAGSESSSKGGLAVMEAGFVARVGNRGGLYLEPRAIHLSLCMIVRDNERTIRPALESIRPWVDEMVVVDTGSRDKTAEIAAELGARVCHFPWCDDFSAARNESLRHARGRWIFWMDSDDTISPENGRGLRSLAFSELDPSILGFIVQVHFPAAGDDGDANLTVVDHVKLFRNRADLRFEGRIHEQVLPAISRVGGTVAWSDLFVLHSGYDHSAEGQKKKLERDLRLLHLEEHERPDHPFTLFNLGMTYADIKQFDRAIGYLTRSIEQSKPGESHLRKAYALLVYSYNQARQHEAAWETCQIGLRFYPHDAELRFRLGILLQDQGRLQEAVTTYREVLEHREDRHLASVDRGINGFKTRHNLAIAYADIGDLASAEEQWRQIVQEVPNYRQGWRGYGDALIRQKKFGEANELAEKLVNGGHLHGEGQFLRGRLAASQGNLNDAIRELEQANSLCPADTEPLRELCRLLFERGDPADAERWLEELVARDPEDASVHFNLGTVRLRRKLIHPAIESFEQSLRLRPDYSLTHIHLGYALRDAEKFDQSLLAFQRALQLSPGNPDATEGARQVVELQKRQDSSG